MAPLKSDLPYTIRRSARARRVRVTVDGAGEVIVTLPKKAAERRAAEAVRELRPWIERRRAALLRAAAEVAREPGTLPYLGADAAGGARARARAGAPPRRRAARPARRRDARRSSAGTAAAPAPRSRPRLDAAVARAGTSYTGLTIRGQRTRWASCSSTGGMSFNWRLLLAPEAVLDYVIEHEVCHLEVMDHSPRFWALLESRVPDWREHADVAAPLRLDAGALNAPAAARRRRPRPSRCVDRPRAAAGPSTPRPSRRRGRRRPPARRRRAARRAPRPAGPARSGARAGRRVPRRGPAAAARARSSSSSSASPERVGAQPLDLRPVARTTTRISSTCLEQRRRPRPSARSRSRCCARSARRPARRRSRPETVAVSGPPKMSVQATSSGRRRRSRRAQLRGRGARRLSRASLAASRASFAGSGPLPSGSTRTTQLRRRRRGAGAGRLLLGAAAGEREQREAARSVAAPSRPHYARRRAVSGHRRRRSRARRRPRRGRAAARRRRRRARAVPGDRAALAVGGRQPVAERVGLAGHELLERGARGGAPGLRDGEREPVAAEHLGLVEADRGAGAGVGQQHRARRRRARRSARRPRRGSRACGRAGRAGAGSRRPRGGGRGTARAGRRRWRTSPTSRRWARGRRG